MPYIIAEPCINVKDKACVEVCPVDCIYEGKDQLKSFIELNKQFFKDNPGVKPATKK